MKREITIVAEPRAERGKNEARRLRAKGSAPAVLYGPGGESVPVAVSPKEVNRILHSHAGHNTIFNLTVQGGETAPVMIVDWQNDPITEALLHVDLKRIDLTQRIRVKVATDESTPVPSAAPVFSSAGWFEREAYDLYGVWFADHPETVTTAVQDVTGAPARSFADWAAANATAFR